MWNDGRVDYILPTVKITEAKDSEGETLYNITWFEPHFMDEQTHTASRRYSEFVDLKNKVEAALSGQAGDKEMMAQDLSTRLNDLFPEEQLLGTPGFSEHIRELQLWLAVLIDELDPLPPWHAKAGEEGAQVLIDIYEFLGGPDKGTTASEGTPAWEPVGPRARELKIEAELNIEALKASMRKREEDIKALKAEVERLQALQRGNSARQDLAEQHEAAPTPASEGGGKRKSKRRKTQRRKSKKKKSKTKKRRRRRSRRGR